MATGDRSYKSAVPLLYDQYRKLLSLIYVKEIERTHSLKLFSTELIVIKDEPWPAQDQ